MLYMGIDLGGTKIAAGLVDENGKIVYKDSVPTLRERPRDEIVRDMALLTMKIMKDAGTRTGDVKSIGIGCPGTPDVRNGILVYANNIDFVNVPLRDEMQKYINLPVFLDNDANCAALAESVAGAARGVENSVTITLGTGIGSGVIIGGKVYSGFNYSAAEFGHMVIVCDGEPCTCGRKGCWESYASATALINQTQKAAAENRNSLVYRLVDGNPDRIDAKTAFDAARQGDETGVMLVRQYIRYLAEGLINVVNIFAPEMLIIGGGVCKEGEYLIKPLRELVYKGIYCKEVAQTQIRVAVMGNDAGIIGAAMLGK